MDEHIMTDAEIFQRAKQWADTVRRQAKAAAAGFPKEKDARLLCDSWKILV